MRTKTLLIAAAALVAGVISSEAQTTVYSLNVVGYMNVSLPSNGYSLFANQLDLDGTGTNNTVNTVVGTNLPAGSKVLAFDPGIGTYRSIQISGSSVWSAGAAGPFVKAGLQPGAGVFIFNNGPATNITVTGNVLQRTNITSYPSQNQIVGYGFPIAGALTTNFNYAANQPLAGVNDKVLQWNVAQQTFKTHQYNGTSWTLGIPNLGTSEGFFLVPNQTTAWTNGFAVP